MTDISSESGVLALVPPLVFGSVSGVKSEDPYVGQPLVGAPLRLTEKDHLEVIVDPLFPPADAGIDLFHNDKQRFVPSDVDELGRTHFLFPSGLLSDKAQSFHYVGRRGSGSDTAPSPKLWVLYNRYRPGGRDPFGGNDFHENLKVDLPEWVKKSGVGLQDLEPPIPLTVSYPYAKLHDVVEVNCNGYRFLYTVLQSDLGGSFDIPIPKEAFIEGSNGGNSGKFVISYRVWDQLENYTENGLPCEPLLIDVDLQLKELDKPDLIEDMAGDDDDPDTIDRTSLKEFLLARVHVRTPLWKKGDSIRLTYTCIPAKGDPVTRTLADVPVNRVPDFLELKIPAAQVIAAARLNVSYSLVRDGVVQASSYVTKSEIVGGGSSELPLPFVPGLVGNIIAPAKYPDGFTMRVDWAAGWKEGDKAKLEVKGGALGVGTPVFEYRLFNANKRANFKFSRGFILANVNRAVEFKWVLLSDGKETGSLPLTLTIEKINATDPNFPTAKIIEADGAGVVDLRLFKGNANFVVSRWPFMDLRDLYWLEVVGVDVGGKPLAVEIANSKEVTQSELDNGVSAVFPREKLMLFKHGSKFAVKMKADLYPNDNNESIVDFREETYTVMTVVSEEVQIVSLKDASNLPIVDGVTSDTTLTIVGKALKNEKVDVFIGNIRIDSVIVSPLGDWMLRVNDLERRTHIFTAKALYGDGAISKPRSVSVVAKVPAKILAVKDSMGREILEGGFTRERGLTISGAATANESLNILNNGVKITEAKADLSGIWTRTLPYLLTGKHSFTVRGIKTGDWESTPPRTLTISQIVSFVQPIVQLSSFLILPAGGVLRQGELRKKLELVGGVAPFRFRSTNPHVMLLTADNYVNALSNGWSTITVTDSLGDEASCSVVVKCSYLGILRESLSDHHGALSWLASQPGAIGMTREACDSLAFNYSLPNAYKYSKSPHSSTIGWVWLPKGPVSITSQVAFYVSSDGGVGSIQNPTTPASANIYAMAMKPV